MKSENKVIDIDAAGIEYFYHPRSIAIVGASKHSTKPGGRPLYALQNRGYAGKIFPVNPSYREVAGLECHPTILDVPDDVDMAIISVPAEAVLEVIDQCAQKGVKAVVIFSAGFSEVGAEGELLQQKITELARRNHMRLLGPNSLGLINSANSVTASFAHVAELVPVSPRTLGFVTQSGAFGAMIYFEATQLGVGFSSFTSVGNEADTEFADFVSYLLDDPETSVIGGYLEGAKNGPKLRRAAEKALQLQKPILIMKVGRTQAGARAASSHTGSLAGDDQIYDAFFRQMGIVRFEALSELTSFAILHRSGRICRGKRVGIISGSGGHGVMVADKCESLGLSVPEITGATRERLLEYLPAFGSPRNPVDLTAQAGRNTSMLTNCVRTLADDDNIDIVVAHAFFQDDDGIQRATELVQIWESTTKLIVIMTHTHHTSPVSEKCVAMLKDAGIPILSDGLQTAQAVANLVWYHDRVRRITAGQAEPEPAKGPPADEVAELLRGPGQLSEFECKRILERCGVSVTREELATSADEAVVVAHKLGYPVVLKIQSSEILHKSDAGGVMLDLGTEDEVRRAYHEILSNARRSSPEAEIQGVLVQEMVQGGVEVIIGSTKDPVFGPVIMFGLGGIFVEALGDVSFRVAPLSRHDAEDMIAEIKGYRVLQGMRGREPVDQGAITDAILCVSRLVTEHRDVIDELDINPLVVFPLGAKAVDALITTSRPVSETATDTSPEPAQRSSGGARN
jgi:acetyltransferase